MTEPQQPLLLRGSLVVLRRKCGKPSCRCTDGELHETAALSYSVGGRTRILSLPPAELSGVRAALARYRAALEQLDRSALAGIQALTRRLEKERSERRKKR